jgi:hypothetical protein
MSASLDDAMQRLAAALDLLDVAVTRRLAVEHGRASLETELQIMQDDRARLALELESASGRLAQVEAATAHVGRRVHTAIGAVREVLTRAEASPDGRA